jgi:hypothetical protein
MAGVLSWQAPVANASKMPPGSSDAAGVMLLGMTSRLGVSLPVVILGVVRRPLTVQDETAMGWKPGTVTALLKLDPVFELDAIYAVWCAQWDAGNKPAELETSAPVALAAVMSDPTMALVYQRCLAIAELPIGTVPTFSAVIGAIRDQWRALSGRDVRVDGPNPPASSSAVPVLAAVYLGWYVFHRWSP